MPRVLLFPEVGATDVKHDKIYLVGFIAAGKTSVARVLGRRLGWRVADVDEIVEARERRTIAAIFAAEGEAYFRAIEREVVRSLLPPRNLVVATGAGTFGDPDLRSAMNRDGLSVWIDVPLETLITRLPPESRRPMAGDRRELEALYLARRGTYQLAHLRLDAERAQVDELAERILDHLGY